MAKKIVFNPFIKGNFDYVDDYAGDINDVKTVNSKTIERVDDMESIISVLQSGQIIPAERLGEISNDNIIYDVKYEHYATLKGAKKFFVILDNPLISGSSPAAEEKVMLRVQTDKEKKITVQPPTVSDTPSETDLYAGMVGYNEEKQLGILVSGGFFYLKQGAYATTDIYSLKCSYTIDEEGKAQLAEYVEPEPEPTEESEELEENEELETPEVPELPEQPVIIVISARDEKKITFETTGGYFSLSDGSTVDFSDQLITTEGSDTWSTLKVMHKDSIDARLKDLLEKRVLMRAIIDENDSANDSAYTIGGVIESTPPASFIPTNAYVIDNLEDDLVLNNDNFPSESVIYIVKAKNNFNADGCSHIIINNNGTGFTTDRSFEVWLEKNTGQKDMLIFKNGKEETNAFSIGECVRLFFDYQTSQWSIVYVGNDNKNNTTITSADNSIKYVQSGNNYDLSRSFYILESYIAGYKPCDISNDGTGAETTRMSGNKSDGYLRFFRGDFTTQKGLIAFDYFSDDGVGISFFGSIQLDLRGLFDGNIIMASNYFEQKNNIFPESGYSTGLKPDDLIVICQEGGRLSLFFKTFNNNTTVKIGFRTIARSTKYEAKTNQWMQMLPAVIAYPSSGIYFENKEVKAIFKNNRLINKDEQVLM